MSGVPSDACPISARSAGSHSQTQAGRRHRRSCPDRQPARILVAATPFNYGPIEMTIEQINTEGHATTYLHHDQQGSTRLLTNESGTITGPDGNCISENTGRARRLRSGYVSSG